MPRCVGRKPVRLVCATPTICWGRGPAPPPDAEAYRDAYAEAIERIGREAGSAALPARPGISVKLSALHPRYTPMQAPRVRAESVPVVLDLARAARSYDLNVTIDAEEAERLELSLDVFGAVLADPSLVGWDGFGLAVQAYSKRCLPVIDHVAALAAHHDRRLMVRLVKGAYWDGEVKIAQVQGLADFPVFTRKAMTDLSYIAAARRLLAYRPRLFPQFATHNALTVASVMALAGDERGFEFQRLHGMGEACSRGSASGCPVSVAASTHRSGGIANCWPISSGVFWRTGRMPRSSPTPPIRPCRSRVCWRVPTP